MKKLLLLFLLLSYLNTNLFFPVVTEGNFYATDGTQVDEINSLLEYADEIIFGHIDTSPDDEDDDTADYYQTLKSVDYHYRTSCMQIEDSPCNVFIVLRTGDHISIDIENGDADVLFPPPKV